MNQNGILKMFVLKDINGKTLKRSSNIEDLAEHAKTPNFKGVLELEVSTLIEDEYQISSTTIIKEY